MINVETGESTAISDLAALGEEVILLSEFTLRSRGNVGHSQVSKSILKST